MRSNIVAYELPIDGTIQVVYQTGDDHIHEMVAGQNRKWRDDDITRVAGGPRLETSIITAYPWPDGRTKQIDYTSPMSDGHIHELTLWQGRSWTYEDIMKHLADIPPSDGISIVGYPFKATGSKYVVYTAADAHIHELSVGVTSPWHYTNLTQAAGTHLVESRVLVAYAWESQKTRQVAYLSPDGHVHELQVDVKGSWKHQDLTQLFEVPLAPAQESVLSGYVWQTGETKQVVYIGDDGDIYEFAAGADNQWNYTDLTAVTSAPLAAGSSLAGFAWETGLSKQVVYVGRDHHVHELALERNSVWKHTDLTQRTHAPEASNDVLAGHEWTAQFAKLVVYLDTAENPHIHSLMLEHGGSWKHTDLTDVTGAEPLV
jgi:hypothetical protein